MKYENLIEEIKIKFRNSLKFKPFSSFVGLDVLGGSGSGNNYNKLI